MSIDLSRDIAFAYPENKKLIFYPKVRKNLWDLYKRKLVAVEEAVQVIKSGDNVVLPLGCGEPPALLEAMARRHHELEDVKVHQMLPIREASYLKPEMNRSFRHVSWFTSGSNRQAVNEGRADFMPGHFHEYPYFFQKYIDVDVFMGTVSPMDERGYFSFGVSVDYTTTAASQARVIILEVNPNMPRTRGESLIHISEVDYIVENNNPIPELPIPALTENDRIIGGFIAELVEDGSTIQLGIGAMPNAVAEALQSKKNLGIHTEMVTDGMVDLVESGAVTGSKKTLHPGKIIGSFAAGTKRLYDFMNDNPLVEMYPVSYVNDPYIIGQNYKMVSINATLQVDLLGQCASETIGPRQYSATGGQTDFARGCLRSPGGKGFIALHSTAKKGQISKIVPMLHHGAVVSCSKNDVDHVVTEYGVAKLRGKTARERALALISIAHPDFRSELRAAARKMDLI
ncbi:acetyl-CoA hydrolase/transferase family protein [Desulfallas thermosapovorans]|uniref:Acyl-CoA hydrolase n=1 Tax=Desulfallas thermosapovorans DSM 6562 TaxID=1121431 RepID=A0A5S4ZYM5_9FIRM|nr:acetyl-CoA hydrolase/transferase C-terminal domain-containing protein [Desulfallas thermosapovorans]TYO97354.1 acyl-CoA hydrolase [Desulfallas thermosapovorans DSM 6562]